MQIYYVLIISIMLTIYTRSGFLNSRQVCKNKFQVEKCLRNNVMG